MNQPSGKEIRFARLNAGLTGSQCAQLVHLALHSAAGAIRWSEYEHDKRNIDLARWELFLIKTGQHPTSSTINGMLVMPVFT